jgi:hypothetical protein
MILNDLNEERAGIKVLSLNLEARKLADHK